MERVRKWGLPVPRVVWGRLPLIRLLETPLAPAGVRFTRAEFLPDAVVLEVELS